VKAKLIAKYEKEASDEVSDLFEVIASLIKQKQREEYLVGSKNYFRSTTPTKTAFGSSLITPMSKTFRNVSPL